MNTTSLPEPAAHMYPSDLEKFRDAETFAHAYSVAVGNPEESSVPLFTLHDMLAHADEFTDNARAALLWVLWHHQGGSSPVGQPIRYALGMGAHEPLSEQQVQEARRWAALTKAETRDFHGR